MDKFIGTFKRIPESVTGFDEYVEAIQMPKNVVDAMRNTKDNTMVMTKNGDTYTMVNDNGEGRTDTISFKLGETFTRTSPHGVPMQGLMKMEGDRLVGEHKNDVYWLNTVRYFEGDKMIVELTANDKTMRYERERV